MDVLILLWLACADPEFRPIANSLSAYDRGQQALEEGMPLRAADAFEAAAEADPARPVLRQWQAWALDKGGESQAAIEVLDAAIQAYPEATDLRYNRAALRARQGHLKRAAADLRWLYAKDVVQPVEVADDRDFLPLAADKELRSLVPAGQVQAEARGESGSVLMGEPFTLELQIVARSGVGVQLEDMGETTGILRHVRTIEDERPEGPLWTRRNIRIVYTAVEGGQGRIGPWLVKAGGTSALTEWVKVDVVQLPDQKASLLPSEASALRLPSGLAEASAPPWIGIENGVRVARLGPPHTISPAVPISPGPVLELWVDGQVRWRQVPLPDGEYAVLQAGKVLVGGD